MRIPTVRKGERRRRISNGVGRERRCGVRAVLRIAQRPVGEARRGLSQRGEGGKGRGVGGHSTVGSVSEREEYARGDGRDRDRQRGGEREEGIEGWRRRRDKGGSTADCVRFHDRRYGEGDSGSPRIEGRREEGGDGRAVRRRGLGRLRRAERGRGGGRSADRRRVEGIALRPGEGSRYSAEASEGGINILRAFALSPQEGKQTLHRMSRNTYRSGRRRGAYTGRVWKVYL
mmetsp:Transcript_18910/g.54767  ORF Transcript_18910/g.54767 Transcript_18910/m.54767 type:complete len:231 (+) Transcript_18910:232-924(+)